MAGSTTKKVQIWRFDRETLSGFVNPLTYLTDSGVEMLTLAGNVTISKYLEIKAVFFVRDFDAASESLPPAASFLAAQSLTGSGSGSHFVTGTSRKR